MDEKQKQEMKEKATKFAQETAQKAQKFGKAAAEKADELYNKLPLDKINEKLGGKVDVKSPKVKIGVFIFIIVAFLLAFSLIFSSNGQDKRRKILARKAVDILNKQFDESFDTCKKVEVGRCFYTGPDYGNGTTTIERYEGRAFIYNSRTGKTRERNVNLTVNLDEGLYIVESN